MNYLQAIKLLFPYHTAQLIWIVPTETSQPPTGQLTTGLACHPIISVDSGIVCSDDLYEILDLHAELSPNTQHVPAPTAPINTPYWMALTN